MILLNLPFHLNAKEPMILNLHNCKLTNTHCWITTSRHKITLRVIHSADKVEAGHKPVNSGNKPIRWPATKNCYLQVVLFTQKRKWSQLTHSVCPRQKLCISWAPSKGPLGNTVTCHKSYIMWKRYNAKVVIYLIKQAEAVYPNLEISICTNNKLSIWRKLL